MPLKTRNSKSEVECSCRICLIARSKYPYSPSSENVETPKKCVSCFSPIGRGHKHSPNSCQLSLTLLDNLEKQVPPHLQEQFGSRIIDKAAKNSAGQTVLNTSVGKPELVSEGPVPEKPVQISHNAFFKMERELGMSRNQINEIKSIVTSDAKKQNLSCRTIPKAGNG